MSTAEISFMDPEIGADMVYGNLFDQPGFMVGRQSEVHGTIRKGMRC
ncbi:MAG: hypothetical protein K9M96_12255 [Deltaproteobacteria bacterium]|nr:hypothetical protein [Deltaproteobacteria bacterium]